MPIQRPSLGRSAYVAAPSYPCPVDVADDSEMKKRHAKAERLYQALALDEDTRPFFVSDEASLYDIQGEDDSVVIAQVAKHYGVTLTLDDFRLPIWMLLDRIDPAP